MESDKPIFVELMGARLHEQDGERTYEPIGPITISQDHLYAFYDHTLILGDVKIRVMESYDDIYNKLHGRVYT